MLSSAQCSDTPSPTVTGHFPGHLLSCIQTLPSVMKTSPLHSPCLTALRPVTAGLYAASHRYQSCPQFVVPTGTEPILFYFLAEQQMAKPLSSMTPIRTIPLLFPCRKSQGSLLTSIPIPTATRSPEAFHGWHHRDGWNLAFGEHPLSRGRQCPDPRKGKQTC